MVLAMSRRSLPLVLALAGRPRILGLAGLAELPRRRQPSTIDGSIGSQASLGVAVAYHYLHSSSRRRIPNGPDLHHLPLNMRLRDNLAQLLSQARPGGPWVLDSKGTCITRPFKFPNFRKAWDFMNAVALQCKLKRHHPEWSNSYDKVIITWTTHDVGGLSEKDIELATICDKLAKVHQEVRDVKPKATEGVDEAKPQATISDSLARAGFL
ncbi:transcriptional coactivator/pterin dehydratase [Lasiosphaeria miniovina]|uniref:4a-hydroxytetrahydrobiopterin dehydratase n=1 Tax=Lasiosphaeria miniovina TaxID=1954250 RepID=A0AA40DVW1_9PEZI|nr:transcriptional coactivator/pterin dehydratase [Lasiosphaeria miniovina]KAK0718279.1 transcriptional coactivator/pterin dehydratase [Lasiosphaeria miniovina]